MISQAYDGTKNMPGKYNGVQAIFPWEKWVFTGKKTFLPGRNWEES